MQQFIECPGKGMIVCATREIAARLYAEIVATRPDWHTDDIATGKIKVVYSGDPSDKPPISDHVRKPSLNAVIKKRLKDEDDELELVIVKDMMLTGYDSPPLHTLYVDRPFKGALLMQTRPGQPHLQGQERRSARCLRTHRRRPDQSTGGVHPGGWARLARRRRQGRRGGCRAGT